MASLPERATITEVGPRDGLQNEDRYVETPQKVELIARLADAGFSRIEAGSFVSAKAIPQMRDTADVFAAMPRREDVTYIALVPNVVGTRNAIAARADELATVVSASETHNKRNINRSVAESLREVEGVAALASDTRAYTEGQLWVDGEAVDASLAFQIYCRSSDAAVSTCARAESPLQAIPGGGSRPPGVAPGQPDIAAALLRAEEQRWEQTRYLASELRSALDAIGAEHKVAQARLEVKLEAGLQEVASIQREILAESREAASLSRAVKRNPLLRVLRRLFG